MPERQTEYPLVSVIIPAYNYAHFLPETLQSVLDQTYPHWECIIVNDGSSDNTQEIANKFVESDSRFRYYFQTNKGRSAARNLGLENAKGNFIQFLDADDLLIPQKFEKQISFFNANSKTEVNYCDFSFYNSETGEVIKTRHFCKEMKNPLRDILLDFGDSGFIIPIHSALFRKEVFSKSDIFTLGIEGREDWLFWVDLALNNCQFSFLNEKLVLYRKHSESTTHNTKLIDFFRFKTAFMVCEKLNDPHKTDFIDYSAKAYAEALDYERKKLKAHYLTKSYKIIRGFSIMRNKLKKVLTGT